MPKAQIAIEIITYYGILLGVFLVTLVLIVNNQNGIDQERSAMDAKRFLVMTKNEIDVAFNVGDGYSSSFVLPEVLANGIQYNISVSAENQEISLVYKNRNVSLSILTNNIMNTIKKGKNIIKNSGGVIIFE